MSQNFTNSQLFRQNLIIFCHVWHTQFLQIFRFLRQITPTEQAHQIKMQECPQSQGFPFQHPISCWGKQILLFI